MCFSKPKVPKITPQPPAQAPQLADRTVQSARDKTRKQAIANVGLSSTNKTGGQGLTTDANLGKRVLGA